MLESKKYFLEPGIPKIESSNPEEVLAKVWQRKQIPIPSSDGIYLNWCDTSVEARESWSCHWSLRVWQCRGRIVQVNQVNCVKYAAKLNSKVREFTQQNVSKNVFRADFLTFSSSWHCSTVICSHPSRAARLQRYLPCLLPTFRLYKEQTARWVVADQQWVSLKKKRRNTRS